MDSIPGLGRYPGRVYDNLLQFYCLMPPMDKEAWRATVHGVAKSQTQPNDQAHLKAISCFSPYTYFLNIHNDIRISQGD